ncbi:MAG: glycine cleavage system protein GcvH [Acidobacteriota bacterium]|nr:MAG: glycine cleavage system protein GcvH [Acidobacteriota bacterium]
MNVPEDLQYTKEHEWISVDGKIVTIGITDFAQQELGDVVYVELPEVDQNLEKEESFGSVESVKAVSEIFTPLDGTVTEINEDLADAPETINEDPYGAGWMIKLELSDTEQLDELMSAEDYIAYVEEESGS